MNVKLLLTVTVAPAVIFVGTFILVTPIPNVSIIEEDLLVNIVSVSISEIKFPETANFKLEIDSELNNPDKSGDINPSDVPKPMGA